VPKGHLHGGEQRQLESGGIIEKPIGGGQKPCQRGEASLGGGVGQTSLWWGRAFWLMFGIKKCDLKAQANIAITNEAGKEKRGRRGSDNAWTSHGALTETLGKGAFT